MPDLKIVKFDGVTKLGVSVEDVLDGNKDLEKVYLVGFKDGELVMATSEAGTWGISFLSWSWRGTASSGRRCL